MTRRPGLDPDRLLRVLAPHELPRPVGVERGVLVEQRALGDLVLDEARPTLERQFSAEPLGHPVGTRPDDRARHSDRPVARRVGERRDQVATLYALLLEPALVRADQPAHVPQRRLRPPRLDVPEHLAQRSELVEVALEELPRRIVVRVEHAGIRMEDLGESGLDQLAAEQLVLRVRDLAVRHALPRPPRQAAVDVGQEGELSGELAVLGDAGRRPVEALDVDRGASVAPHREMALHLRLDGVAGIGTRVVGPEDGGHVVSLLEALQQRGEPPRRCRGRVLGDEGHVVTRRELHQEIARAPV